MGITTSFGIVTTKELEQDIQNNSKEAVDFLEKSDERFEKDNFVLHVFENVRGPLGDSYSEHHFILELLGTLNEEGDQYIVVEACPEFPSNENYWGCLYENPFELGTAYKLYYNV